MANPLPASVLRRLADAVHDLHSSSASESFGDRTIRTSNALVPGEISVYTELDPEAGRLHLEADGGHAELAAVHGEFLRLQHQHPAIQHEQATGETGVRVISQLVTRKQWHAQDLYQNVFRGMGLGDQLVVSAPVRQPQSLGITINRSRPGFRAQEVGVMELYSRHFIQAFSIEQSMDDHASLEAGLAGARKRMDPLSPYGLIVVDGAGAILTHTGDAARLLQAYFPASRRSPGRLPAEVRRRLASLTGSPDERLQASPVLTKGSGRGTVLVEIQRQPRMDRWTLLVRERDEAHERRALRAKLSPRQGAVLDFLLTGQSEKEIAASLGLTVNTVHGYVKEIFRHLRVHSRHELMALWIHPPRA